MVPDYSYQILGDFSYYNVLGGTRVVAMMVVWWVGVGKRRVQGVFPSFENENIQKYSDHNLLHFKISKGIYIFSNH